MSLSPQMIDPARRRWTPVDAIKSYILERQLHPGDPMPTETELCAELGVSRSSVREAMRTLASLDIVNIRHGHGTYVGNLSLAPLVSGLVFRSTLNTDQSFRTLREVVALRIALDLGVTDELVQIHQGHQNPDLRALVDTMREQMARGESFAEADGAFHRELLQGVDNDLVRELVSAFWEIHTAVVPRLGIAPDTSISDTVEAHGLMLDALESGDPDAYRLAVMAHYQPLLRAIDSAAEGAG